MRRDSHPSWMAKLSCWRSSCTPSTDLTDEAEREIQKSLASRVVYQVLRMVRMVT
jgi:hypothetical protein